MAKRTAITAPVVREKVQEVPFIGKAEYEVVKSYRQSAKGIPLLVGYRLKLCSDDWYQVYDAMGEKMHFKIGPKFMRVIDRIEVIKITE